MDECFLKMHNNYNDLYLTHSVNGNNNPNEDESRADNASNVWDNGNVQGSNQNNNYISSTVYSYGGGHGNVKADAEGNSVNEGNEAIVL